MFFSVVATSAPRMGEAVCPPGTLSCKVPSLIATFSIVYLWEYGEEPWGMVSLLIARVSLGKALRMEKSMLRIWVKLLEPSTVQRQPSSAAGDELPAKPVGGGRADGWFCGDVDEPQVPKAGWQPVPQ